MSSNSQSRAMFLWFLAIIFFAFQFILRLSVGLLREEIMQKFAIDAASFGTLAGYYYLGYSGAQIPLGMMLDRLSFRFVTFASIAIAALGSLLFVKAESWEVLLFSRLLIGAGSGVAFLSVAKVIKTCFDSKYHALMIGFSFSFGLTGAYFGNRPMLYLFDQFGYQSAFDVLTIVGLCIAFSILLFGKMENSTISARNENDGLYSILKLLVNPKILVISISGGLMVGSLEGFADVWALPFFNQSMSFTKTESADIISFVYIGMCFGGPILTAMATMIRSVNLTIFLTGILTILIFLILFYLPFYYFSFIISAALMFVLGILCCYQVLVFVLASNAVDSKSTGLAIAIINCINMSFGHFFHSIIGSIFNSSWNGLVNSAGSPIYTHDNFVYALSIIPICTFIGQFGFIFLSKKLRG